MSIVVPLVRELVPPAEGDEVVSFTVTPLGEALTTWASASGRAQLYDEALFERTPWQGTLATPVPVRVTRDAPDTRTTRLALTVRTAFPTVHAMPGGGVLVVGARAAARSPVEPEHNGWLYDAEGETVRSACLGDGVAEVVTTASGRIWVGYHDEGVFGNLGWGNDGPVPIGSPGLNVFDDQFDLAFSNEVLDIFDCYALSGDGERAIVCAYFAWTLGIFEPDGCVASYAQGVVGGARAIARAGDVIVFVGGYAADWDRVVAARLIQLRDGGSELRWLAAGRLALPDGTSHVVGRDGALHILAGTRWHRIAVQQVVAALDLDEGRPAEPATLRVTIARVTDEAFPVWVECQFHDAGGDVHTFVEKLPVVLDASAGWPLELPRVGGLRCTVAYRRQNGHGQTLACIDTREPDGVVSSTGNVSFEVLADQLELSPPVSTT